MFMSRLWDTSPSSASPFAEPRSSKEEVLREITAAVTEHVDRSAVATVNAAWQKGKMIFEKMQQQQEEQAQRVEQQLLACAAGQRAILEDNDRLRRSLLKLVQSLPAQPCAGPIAPVASATEDAATTAPPSDGQGDFETKTVRFSEEAKAASEEDAASRPAISFTLTLRKADDVPLGLELARSDDERRLVVESVREGGAVEAWNRQCTGDVREVRRGDCLVMINSVEGTDAMLTQCQEKCLLKITVERPSVERSE